MMNLSDFRNSSYSQNNSLDLCMSIEVEKIVTQHALIHIVMFNSRLSMIKFS
jgi:hypothetical protein